MGSPSRRPLSTRERQLLTAGLHFSEIFPLISGDRTRFERMVGLCNVCHGQISDVNTFASKRATLCGVIVVEGIGICHRCRVATPFYLRFHAQGHIDGPSPVDGRWTTWRPWAKPATPRWWDLVALLKRLWRAVR